MAGEVTKVLYVVVIEDDETREERKESSLFRYTRPVLQSTLQLMGCKPRHALKISGTVFKKIRSDELVSADRDLSREDDSKGLLPDEASNYIDTCLDKVDDKSKSKPFELYKKRTTIVVRRKTFLDVVCDALTEYKYMGPNQRDDLALACRIRERKESVTVLLCGTSGCGKSTLSALLGSRLGITTVVSTDSIRHMMRSFVDENQNPLLWASTYHAGEYLDPVAVAEAKEKIKAKKLSGISTPPLRKQDGVNGVTVGKSPLDGFSSVIDVISSKQMAIEGYKAQSEMVIDSLDRLITSWEKQNESVVVEGVHLSLNFVLGLMKKHPSIIPVMVYIVNEEKHLKRFTVRAKYMTLDPAKNKYVKYIRNNRTIQEYLCNRADKYLVPKINNTNVDRSVAGIHATVFSCLRRREAGEQLYDPITNMASIIDEEYRSQCGANCMSSKGMFQLIQRQGSSRQLMALLNDDGSVAKAWPVRTETPMYGPMHIGTAEPINLQFGHFGISAWLSDTGGGTSHASSFDESRGELKDNGSRYFSSCCTTPRFSDGHAKELKEEQSVHGSDDDEEVYEPPEIDSDEDPSGDDSRHIDRELEGSVDEDYTQSDEEYDDLAMLGIQENAYLMDDSDKDTYNKFNLDDIEEQKYKQNTDHFRSKSETLSESPLDFYSSLFGEKNEKEVPTFGNIRTRKRSNSIPTHAQNGAFTNVYSFSEARPR